jgi:hypothetical protein
MSRFLLCCVLLLSACGANDRRITTIATEVPLELRQPEPGWRGGVPQNEGQLSDALIVTAQALARANAKIVATDEILTKAERR